MKEMYKEIKKELEKSRRSFSWLAKQVGYSRQGLKTSFMNGNVKYETILKIASLLGINAAQLLLTLETMSAEEEALEVLKEYDSDDQNELEVQDQNELLTENTVLKKKIENLEKEVDSYRKMIDVLYRKDIRND